MTTVVVPAPPPPPTLSTGPGNGNITIGVGGTTTVTTGVGLFTYAYNPSDKPNSLFHSDATEGQVYGVAYGDETMQAGSDGHWLTLNKTSYPPGGTFAYSSDATYGHIRDGLKAQFALIAPSEGVDVRAALVKCDATLNANDLITGGTTGQAPLMHSLRDWSIAQKISLRGGGIYRVESRAGGAAGAGHFGQLDMKNATLHWRDLKLACDPGYDDWMLLMGANSKNSAGWEAHVFLWGDNHAFGNSSAAKGVRIYDQQSELGNFSAKVAYFDYAVDLFGNTENLHGSVQGEYCNYLLTVTQDDGNLTGTISGTTLTVSAISSGRVIAGSLISGSTIATSTVQSQLTGTPGGIGTYSIDVSQTVSSPATIFALAGSPDDNNIYLGGHNCKHWLWCAEGTDSSIDVEFNTQNRTRSDDGVAAVTYPTGKNGRARGFIRGHNGPEDNFTFSKNHGVSAFHFDDVVLEHGYATALRLQWIGRISGTITIRDYNDDNSGSGAQSRTVYYGRIAYAGGLRVNIEAGGAKYNAQVGDDTYFPVDVDLGELITQRGTPEATIPQYTDVTGTALRLYKARNASLRVLQADGDVRTDAGVSGFNLEMPTTWLIAKQGSYVFDVHHTAPQLQVNFRGACYGADILEKSWLFAGVRVECVIDYDNAPFSYSLGYWKPTGIINATALMLASRTSDYNALMGGEGVTCWDTTNHRNMSKSATSQTGAWQDQAGGNANTVGYQTITGTFMTTISGFAGATAPATGSIEKDGIDIVFAGLADIGYTPTCMYWLAPTAGAAGTARDTPRSNMMNSATFGLTEAGYSSSWAAGTGYTGNGSSFKLTGLPDVAAGDGGLGLNSLYVGFMSTVHNSGNAHVVAAINGKLKGRGKANNGGDFSVSTTQATDYSAASGDAPMFTALARYGAADTRGYRNDKLDVVDTTSSTAGGGVGGAPTALILFYETLANVYSTETLNFFIMGPAPANDNQAIQIARVIRKGLRHAGKVTW